jgi:hypothetical protein
MNWDAIGAIGQAVSALALVFVLVQVRHAREEAQRAARQSRHDGMREIWLAQARQPDLLTAMHKLTVAMGGQPAPFIAYAVHAGLGEVEARQVAAYGWAVWQNIQASIESNERFSAGAREELDRTIVSNCAGTNPFAKWYEITKPRLNPDAVAYIEQVLARAETKRGDPAA